MPREAQTCQWRDICGILNERGGKEAEGNTVASGWRPADLQMPDNNDACPAGRVKEKRKWEKKKKTEVEGEKRTK